MPVNDGYRSIPQITQMDRWTSQRQNILAVLVVLGMVTRGRPTGDHNKTISLPVSNLTDSWIMGMELSRAAVGVFLPVSTRCPSAERLHVAGAGWKILGMCGCHFGTDVSRFWSGTWRLVVKWRLPPLSGRICLNIRSVQILWLHESIKYIQRLSASSAAWWF